MRDREHNEEVSRGTSPEKFPPYVHKEHTMSECTREAAAEAATAIRRPHRQWLVLRHGGRSNNSWRNAAEREAAGWGNPYTEGNARTLFGRISTRLRQGAVALINPTGEVVEFDSAPLLRTRW